MTLAPARREEIERLAREDDSRDSPRWGPEGDEPLPDWSDEEWDVYWRARFHERAKRQPAQAPVWWPHVIPLAALAAASEAAGLALFRQRDLAALPFTLAGLASMPAQRWLERRRALQLGLGSAAEQPEVPLRLPITLHGVGPTVSVPLAHSPGAASCGPTLAFLAFSAPGTWLWRRRHRDAADPSWATLFGRALSLELLRRYDWRRAGGPT